MSSQEFLVAFGTSDAYVPGAAALVTSLGRNGHLRPGHRVVLVKQELSADSERFLREVAATVQIDLEVRQASPVPDSYVVSSYVSRVTYLRLQAPHLFADTRRVLYLDADTLVRGSLEPLFELDLGTLPFGAVYEYFDRIAAAFPGKKPLRDVRASGGLKFNAGVLLIAPDAWNANDISRKATEFLVQHPDLCPFLDQDALNAVVPEWLELDPIWNLYPLVEHLQLPPLRGFYRRYREMTDALIGLGDAARIVQYIGPVKPWHDRFPSGPNREIFLDHLPESRGRRFDAASLKA